MTRAWRIALAATVLAAPLPAAADRWDFDVYIDEKPVGNHRFEVVETGDGRRVISEADFRYRFLFIPAYRYEHTNTERWEDGCLAEITARTDANGKVSAVTGTRSPAGFRVETGESTAQLPPCVMSFAYWNPEFLQQPRLLNPQTGDYVDVTVEKSGREMLEVRGEAVPAEKYRLTAYGVDLTLWYSPGGDWLALESVARGGRVIRYELS